MSVFTATKVTIGKLLGITAAGQAAMAASVPVAIASNQTAIPVTDNGGSLGVDDNGGSITTDSPQLPATLGRKSASAALATVMASEDIAQLAQAGEHALGTVTLIAPTPLAVGGQTTIDFTSTGYELDLYTALQVTLQVTNANPSTDTLRVAVQFENGFDTYVTRARFLDVTAATVTGDAETQVLTILNVGAAATAVARTGGAITSLAAGTVQHGPVSPNITIRVETTSIGDAEWTVGVAIQAVKGTPATELY